MRPTSRSQPLLIEPLAASQVGALYPIVRTAEPHLSLRQWQKYASTVARGRGQRGVLVARRDGTPFPCGVLCYRLQHGMGSEKLVEIEHIAAADLLDPDPVLAALLAELEVLARQNGCGAVRAVLPSLPAALIRAFGGAGHQLCGVVLGKALAFAAEGASAGVPQTGSSAKASSWRDRQLGAT